MRTNLHLIEDVIRDAYKAQNEGYCIVWLDGMGNRGGYYKTLEDFMTAWNEPLAESAVFDFPPRPEPVREEHWDTICHHIYTMFKVLTAPATNGLLTVTLTADDVSSDIREIASECGAARFLHKEE